MKKILLVIVLLTTGTLFASPSFDVEEFHISKVSEFTENGHQFLLIEGLCTSSSKVVKDVKIYESKVSVNVRPTIGLNIPNKPDSSGSLKVKIALLPSVETITFGQSETVIWRRG